MSTHKVAVALRTQAHSNGATQKLRVGIYLVKSFRSFLLGETSLPLKKNRTEGKNKLLILDCKHQLSTNTSSLTKVLSLTTSELKHFKHNKPLNSNITQYKPLKKNRVRRASFTRDSNG